MITFDIHALQERFYFGDNITPCFETGIPLLLEELKKLPDAKDVVIAYPDEGAGLSQSPHTASLISHTRPDEGTSYLCPYKTP
jgi:hypothetical protein|tara:strand:- start:1779 stop:2027 length:249 start_codon:yes stop_codon:yes gene_type:complete